MPNISDKIFKTMERATRSAFDRVGQVSGSESDPDLSLYQSLVPQDFAKLMEDYGENEVLDYIKTMEGRRVMKNG